MTGNRFSDSGGLVSRFGGYPLMTVKRLLYGQKTERMIAGQSTFIRVVQYLINDAPGVLRQGNAGIS